MQQLLRLPLLWTSVVLLALAGCTSTPHRAPVEDRSVGKSAGASSSITGTAVTPAPESKPLPGAENAGKPGYYTVKPGDTLIRIAMDNGQGWRDVAKWNGMDNPNLIEVGQVLRVAPPGVDPSAVTTRPLAASKVETRPLDSKTPATSPAASAATSTPTTTASSSPATKDDDDISWGWPASGQVVAGFDEVRNKGMSFSGKAGDPVFAAADGRVMYAGAGLRGYGNMIIIKHSTNYLTAYAHNQTLLVKEDQVVRKGQKIAEMGSSDADQVKLHFEVRKQGKPIDPSKLLPAR
ncbi:peptidoglycan DD-metalloendopeptidase family protein [Roseateles chitosanitabidus]|uniref:peptidoglycan DD-metalloendopeptidase family protein n=1 Tax=Roseateles chitosanitabidus TaxID=65048 RepID=UPI00082E8956|nr:peptidoglycan DD-metalloendopeptidase family protein [Roseateles chitosanitabidus]